MNHFNPNINNFFDLEEIKTKILHCPPDQIKEWANKLGDLNNHLLFSKSEKDKPKNWKIEITSKTTIRLKTEKVAINLNKFLNPDYTFKKGNEYFTCKTESKFVSFVEKDKDCLGFILVLLHEIRHTQQKWIYPKFTLKEKTILIFHTIPRLIHYFLRIFFYLSLFKKPGIKRERLLFTTVNILLPQKFSDLFDKLRAEQEGDAWAYALEQIQKWESDKIIYLTSTDKILLKKYLTIALTTHELGAYLDQLEAKRICPRIFTWSKQSPKPRFHHLQQVEQLTKHPFFLN